MREIKFRGKSLDNGEWKYGSLLSVEDTCFIIEDGDFDFNYITESHAFWFDCTEKEVNPKTVGQFTGLKDKNGKEIWEGDIVNVSWCKEKITMQVLMQDGEWVLNEYGDDTYQSLYDFRQNELEIIGNIHDNPELLEEMY